MKEIYFRFARPIINAGKLLLDIDARASAPLKIFGINLRFFYDTRIFKPALTTNTDFKIILPPGYRKYNEFNGNSPSGWALFGSTGAITYINTAVELTSPDNAINVGTEFTKVLQFHVTPRMPLVGEQCPAFIIDKRAGEKPGSFLSLNSGPSGIECTEYLRSEGGEMYTGPVTEYGIHMNWLQDPLAVKYPWGNATKSHCFEMSNIF